MDTWLHDQNFIMTFIGSNYIFKLIDSPVLMVSRSLSRLKWLDDITPTTKEKHEKPAAFEETLRVNIESHLTLRQFLETGHST